MKKRKLGLKKVTSRELSDAALADVAGANDQDSNGSPFRCGYTGAPPPTGQGTCEASCPASCDGTCSGTCQNSCEGTRRRYLGRYSGKMGRRYSRRRCSVGTHTCCCR